MPFIGHFRAILETENACLAAAGRVAAHDGIVPGFQAARILEGALHGIRTDDVADRHDLLRRAWTALFDIDRCDFGPSSGADLSILFAARDGDGMGIAGIGLGGVWGSGTAELSALVEGAHPLLQPSGMPDATPGVLTLDSPVDAVFAVPSHLEPILPTADNLLARCGVHP
jgi:hypothetical protein